MIIFAQLAAAARRTRVIAVAAMLLVTLATDAGSAFAAATAGPVDPATQFPAWYQDANGLQLALCLAGPPNCLVAAAVLERGGRIRTTGSPRALAKPFRKGPCRDCAAYHDLDRRSNRQ